jgi:short-subunit dehydrogenase
LLETVNNVGIYVPHFLTFAEMTEELIWDTVHLNVAPVLLMTKMLLPQMKKNRRGAIVNVSSMADLQPTPLISVYSASKVSASPSRAPFL